jgi:hypothetical protein
MHNQFRKKENKVSLDTELRQQNSFSQIILKQKAKVCYLSPNIVNKCYSYFNAVIAFLNATKILQAEFAALRSQ